MLKIENCLQLLLSYVYLPIIEVYSVFYAWYAYNNGSKINYGYCLRVAYNYRTHQSTDISLATDPMPSISIVLLVSSIFKVLFHVATATSLYCRAKSIVPSSKVLKSYKLFVQYDSFAFLITSE